MIFVKAVCVGVRLVVGGRPVVFLSLVVSREEDLTVKLKTVYTVYYTEIKPTKNNSALQGIVNKALLIVFVKKLIADYVYQLNHRGKLYHMFTLVYIPK